MWKVVRHGGKRNHGWRDVAVKPTEEEARAVYKHYHLIMRCGGLALVDPEGIRIEETWCPNLRTRW